MLLQRFCPIELTESSEKISPQMTLDTIGPRQIRTIDIDFSTLPKQKHHKKYEYPIDRKDYLNSYAFHSQVYFYSYSIYTLQIELRMYFKVSNS